MTVSFSKSISVLHASIRENARRARLAGDQQAAAYWAGREEKFQEVLHRANRAALEYLQTWAGVTRTGYHGIRVDGQEPGRFEEAGLIVTSWLQGTSRDGDPQDHIHNQIARITRTVSDGKWRAQDTASLRAVLGALQAVAATAVECELTREFGVEWVPRADGRGNEIRGVTQAQMDAYSTRTVQVHEKERELARAWERRHGRAPNSRELLLHRATTRRCSHARARTRARSTGTRWRAVGRHDRRRAGAASPRQYRTHAARAKRTRRAAAASPAARSAGGPPSREEQARAVAKALAWCRRSSPTWTRHDLLKQLALVMPAQTRQMNPQAAQELLLGLAEEALSGRAGDVVCLEAPEWPPLPRSLRRELDGRSVYTRPGTARYATAAQLSAWKSSWSRTRRRKARRGCPASWPRAAWAPTARCLRRSCATARRSARAQSHAARAAAGPGRRRLARAHLGPHRGGDHRPGRDRQDPGPGRRRPGLGRAGVRHRDLPERHQRAPRAPASRSPRTPPGCSPTSPRAGSRPAR